MSSLDNRFGIESIYSNYQVALAKRSNSIGISEIINSLNKNGTITIIPSESNILEKTSYLVAYTLKSYNWVFMHLFEPRGRFTTEHEVAK